jgi:hypothetical protein
MPIVAIRVTALQARELRAKARQRKLTVSDYLRNLAFPEKKPAGRWKITGRPGRMILIPPPGTPPITDAEIKAIEEAEA